MPPMRHLSTLLLLVCLCTGAMAQSYSIKGTVADTLNDNKLPNACITVMRARDSVMESFTRTKEDGSFSVKTKAKGKYLIMATFPGLADYVDIIEIKDDAPFDMGLVPMVSKTHLLQEFVLTQQYAAIKVKGDTIEYLADSFKTRDNATVEALLKKLPGIQVDKNGQIVAQGEKVQKVLVDGEEFFTDDPAVVTKSLQAKAVDKVQVFDKKSEQAEFTGIDDGEKTRTINLQLKDDKKKGYFGKIIAGGGTGDQQSFFENQAMFNAFKGKRKLSAFGIMANTGKVGLGWEDRDKFGGGGGGVTEVTDDGGIMTYYNSDDDDFESWSGTYNGQGLPRAWTGGLHYSNKWKQDKHHLGGNYRYGKQDIETTTNTLIEYSLPNDKKNFNRQTKDVYSVGQRHRGDGLYEWKMDSTSTLKVTANAGYSNTKSTSVYNADNRNELDSLLSTNDRRVTSDATTKSINSTLDWRKKFKKKGRTISVNISENYRETMSDGLLLSTNILYERDSTTGSLLSTKRDETDQQKQNENTTLSLSSRLSYTEPLSKVTFLEVNYAFKVDNNSAKRETYNKKNPLGDVYDTLDSTFSNNYAFNIMTHTGGSNLRFMFKKINFSFGGSVSNAAFQQKDQMQDTSYNYNFTNFFPKANFQYSISKQSRIRFDYNGSTRQPTIEQIQPLRNNLDPLNIAIGNAALTQEFRHNLRLSFNDYKMLTNRYIWASVSMNLIDNAISRSENIDAIGRRTYQYINVDGNYSGWGYISYGTKIKALNLHTGIHANVNVNHISNIVNGRKNISDNNTYTLGLDFSYDSENEKFSISYDPSISYNDNKSTINTQTTSFWTTEQELEMSYELPWKFEVGTDINWYIRERTSVFDRNNNVFKWNAYVSKKFLKNDQLELRMSMFDILNQNLGFYRYAQNNYVTEDNYNTIRRYGLLSLTWNFTKSAAGVPQQESNIIITP